MATLSVLFFVLNAVLKSLRIASSTRCILPLKNGGMAALDTPKGLNLSDQGNALGMLWLCSRPIGAKAKQIQSFFPH